MSWKEYRDGILAQLASRYHFPGEEADPYERVHSTLNHLIEKIDEWKKVDPWGTVLAHRFVAEVVWRSVHNLDAYMASIEPQSPLHADRWFRLVLLLEADHLFGGVRVHESPLHTMSRGGPTVEFDVLVGPVHVDAVIRFPSPESGTKQRVIAVLMTQQGEAQDERVRRIVIRALQAEAYEVREVNRGAAGHDPVAWAHWVLTPDAVRPAPELTLVKGPEGEA